MKRARMVRGESVARVEPHKRRKLRGPLTGLFCLRIFSLFSELLLASFEMPEGAFVDHKHPLRVERRTTGSLESLNELTLGGCEPPRFGRAHGGEDDLRMSPQHASAPRFSHRHASVISDRQTVRASTQKSPHDSRIDPSARGGWGFFVWPPQTGTALLLFLFNSAGSLFKMATQLGSGPRCLVGGGRGRWRSAPSCSRAWSLSSCMACKHKPTSSSLRASRIQARSPTQSSGQAANCIFKCGFRRHVGTMPRPPIRSSTKRPGSSFKAAATTSVCSSLARQMPA